MYLMSKKLKYFYIIFILIALVCAGNFVILPKIMANKANTGNQEKAENLDKEVAVVIKPKMTFFEATGQAGLEPKIAQELLTAAKDVYDLSQIRVDRELKFTFAHDDNTLKQLMYPISTEEELYIKKADDNTWQAVRQPINYDIKLKTVSGTIDTSLYESAMAQNIDERAVIALADVFAWTIDFGMGIYQGDTYKFIYEERYRNGQYVMPGKILAARFVNAGQTVEGFYFSEGTDADGQPIEGYYDVNGKSLQKIFLKVPVNFKYISSGFTTGRRYISAFNISTGHRAIDYAATYGAPIVAVGDGVVTHASWSSAGYGNLVSIRHNSTYSTNYGHMSKFAVKVGIHVKQGQVIGYVGSTGLSTGPHVHFEMVQNGVKVNPQKVDIPSGKAIAPENMDKFKLWVADWQKKLN